VSELINISWLRLKKLDNFSRAGESAGVILGVDKVAVCYHIKDSTSARSKRDFTPQCFLQFVRQTDGSRPVVSNGTVVYLDLHRNVQPRSRRLVSQMLLAALRMLASNLPCTITTVKWDLPQGTIGNREGRWVWCGIREASSITRDMRMVHDRRSVHNLHIMHMHGMLFHIDEGDGQEEIWTTKSYERDAYS
jgi:hypothetical protein